MEENALRYFGGFWIIFKYISFLKNKTNSIFHFTPFKNIKKKVRNTLSFHFSPFLESPPLIFHSTPEQNLKWHLVQRHVIIDIWHRPKNWTAILDISSKSVFKIIVCVLNWKINHNGISSNLFSFSIKIHYFKAS